MKSGFIALIGRPNVGKSTLMNHLIGQKIAITSEKPQTTRNRIRTVFTDERGQIVFEDTPGLIQSRNKLDEYMMDVSSRVMKDADAVLWITEASEYIGASEKQIAKDLERIRKPVILVINKTDKLSNKNVLLKEMEEFRKLFRFNDIVPVSALRDTNTDELLNILFSVLPEGPQFYDAETVTNEPMKEIAAEMIREQALRLLKEEVPHGIAVMVQKYSERPSGELIDIEADIICERENHKGIIIGKGGSMLKKIGTLARKSIEDTAEKKVNLKLFVKVRKDWRENPYQVKDFGYDTKKLKK